MLGFVVFGSRTWIWTTAAPDWAASMQDRAICGGVTGTAGFFPGESADPVTAQEMMTLRCILLASPTRRADRSNSSGPIPTFASQFGRLACECLEAKDH